MFVVFSEVMSDFIIFLLPSGPMSLPTDSSFSESFSVFEAGRSILPHSLHVDLKRFVISETKFMWMTGLASSI